MITVEQIKSIINQKLAKENIFLVDISVDQLNRIKVIIDNMTGISIDKCVEISRMIENSLDRDIEDFELEVSSPGIDRPLTLPFQYKKNTGKQLEIQTKDGTSIKGVLICADNEKIELEVKVKESVGSKKKTEVISKKINLLFLDIKTAKVKITF